MTHDELLAKIDTDQEITAYINAGLVNGEIPLKTGRQHWNQSNALRAVVERHTYIHPNNKKTAKGGRIRKRCIECGFAYPCPTIQAIEKELK